MSPSNRVISRPFRSPYAKNSHTCQTADRNAFSFAAVGFRRLPCRLSRNFTSHLTVLTMYYSTAGHSWTYPDSIAHVSKGDVPNNILYYTTGLLAGTHRNLTVEPKNSGKAYFLLGICALALFYRLLTSQSFRGQGARAPSERKPIGNQSGK